MRLLGPKDVDAALGSFFAAPAAELRGTCVDNCISHCRGFEHVCKASCEPRSCQEVRLERELRSQTRVRAEPQDKPKEASAQEDARAKANEASADEDARAKAEDASAEEDARVKAKEESAEEDAQAKAMEQASAKSMSRDADVERLKQRYLKRATANARARNTDARVREQSGRSPDAPDVAPEERAPSLSDAYGAQRHVRAGSLADALRGALGLTLVQRAPPDPEAALAGVILLALGASFAGVVWVERSRLQRAPPGELLASGAVLLYVLMTTACDIFIQVFYARGSDGYDFYPQVLVLLCELAKGTVCAGLAVALGCSCSRDDLAATARRMVVPALCFSYLNVMRFVALAEVHLGEYRVWRSADILFTAAFWVALGQRRLQQHQLAGIFLVFAACVVLSLDEYSHAGLWETLVVLSLALVGALGLVTNDLSFKADAVPFLVQNVVLYGLTSTVCGGLVAATVPLGAALTGVRGLVLAYLASEVAMGLCVACVLKYANALVKSMASTWLAPLGLVLGHYSVGTPLTVHTAGATVLAAAGNFWYRLAPPAPPAEKEDAP